ncbi:MAG: PepSY domain-containing protein [Pseudomonadota bacterium]
MTDTTDLGRADARSPASGGAFYRLVWKWHFLASLYVLPFMAMLAITGALYLYKPQIERWLYSDISTVEAQDTPLTLDAQRAAVETTLDPKRIRSITQGTEPTAATKFEIDDAQGTRAYAWVNPYTGEITGTLVRDTMAMRLVQKVHGELLLGDIGTKFVELAAHWAIVMFITGAVLWWPRGRSKLIVTPKGTAGHGGGRRIFSRGFWRPSLLCQSFSRACLGRMSGAAACPRCARQRARKACR